MRQISLLFLVCSLGVCAAPVLAQDQRAYDGPPAPTLPATVARDSAGRTTVRAVRVAASLRIDGNLDEEIYRTVQPISDFIQVEPQPGAPGTEKTEVWVSFDDDNVYVSVRASESAPEQMIVNEMRRDSTALVQNENFQFAFDTFYDRRNSMSFQFNPLGGRMDGQVTNESQFNPDWNPVWRLAVRRTAGGWAGEAAVPFKSLRFSPGPNQIWGIHFRRINRWKNEISYLTRMPASIGTSGHQRVSDYATLVGIEVPSGSRTLELKPFVASSLASDVTTTPAVRNDLGGDVGFDVKYGLTPNVTADVTYNTDFAQVEADEQQVNLTRFGLFFPEKREFFLENQGLFVFGGQSSNNQGDTPTLFYSRRIGLESGHLVPIGAGGRVTGRAGPYTIGLIDIQTRGVDGFGVPSTNFGVARVRRDILRRSAIGAILTGRSADALDTGSSATYGLDATFGFFANLTINSYWARTTNPGLRGDDTSYRTQVNFNGDRYGYQFEQLAIGKNFAPSIGFVRRDDFTKSRVQLRFSPRPKRIRGVRKFTYQASAEYFENGAGQKESRELLGNFETEFQSSDRLQVKLQDNYELLAAPFKIARGVVVPAGGYTLRFLRVDAIAGQQRMFAGDLFVEHGPFYDGTRTTIGYSSARAKFSPHFAVEPGVSINRVTLPYGEFTATLVSGRATYAVTPQMFLSGLVQYNSSNNTLGANVRFRWEYLPGSELFVVYNEGRDTSASGLPTFQNRAVAIKVTRLLRF